MGMLEPKKVLPLFSGTSLRASFLRQKELLK